MTLESLTVQQFLLQIYQRKPELQKEQQLIITYVQTILKKKSSLVIDDTFLQAIEQHIQEIHTKNKAEHERQQQEKKIAQQEIISKQEHTDTTQNNITSHTNSVDGTNNRNATKQTNKSQITTNQKSPKKSFAKGFVRGLSLATFVITITYGVAHLLGPYRGWGFIQKAYAPTNQTEQVETIDIEQKTLLPNIQQPETAEIFWTKSTFVSGEQSFGNFVASTGDTQKLALDQQRNTCKFIYSGEKLELPAQERVLSRNGGNYERTFYPLEQDFDAIVNTALRLGTTCETTNTNILPTLLLTQPRMIFALHQKTTGPFLIPQIVFDIQIPQESSGLVENIPKTLNVNIIQNYYN